MKISKAVQALLFTLLLSTTAITAQQMQMPQVQPADSVSEAELKMFVDVAMELQNINTEADSLVAVRLSEENMEQDRFREIMMAERDPAKTVELTSEEDEIVATMKSYLQELSMTVQKQQMEVVQKSEIDPMRFQSIATALQQDRELAARFQQIIAEMEGATN